MSDVDKMHRCPDCGKPMTLAPGIDYFCETPACSEKMFEEFAKGVRNYAVRREHAPKARTDPTGKDATIEFLTRQLEEARGRIGELETSLSAQTRITDAGHRSQKEMLERIASLEAALKLIKDFPITHPQENQDAANMAEIARSTLEGKDNA